jgi:YegS/Rv2252/BmrU family lipid kinase
MKHIFIINPAAGTGQSEKSILPEIIKFIKEHGSDFEIHRSLNKPEIGSYVKARAAQGLPVRFYAVGGDGTICDVLNGMAEYGNAELAVIPCGSGNDFVRNFSHKENFLKIQNIVDGEIEHIDVIQYNGMYCMNMLNIGTDCDINVLATRYRAKKRYKGAMSYAAAAVKVLPKGKTYDFEYTDENGETQREEVLLACVGNGKFCGGGFKPCPEASLIDGKMDVCIVRPTKGARLAKLLVDYHQGNHLKPKDADKLIKYFQTTEFTLTPHCNAFACVDGETFGAKETHFKTIPRAIKFVVPKGSKLNSK